MAFYVLKYARPTKTESIVLFIRIYRTIYLGVPWCTYTYFDDQKAPLSPGIDKAFEYYGISFWFSLI